MARGVDNVDFGVLIKNGGVLGKDGDSPFPFDVIGIHDTFLHLLVGPEHAALLEQLVHQRGFAMVYVGDNGDVADILSCCFHK